jgi:hypothetical protein
MAMPGRGAIRAALKALFQANGAWVAGYSSQPKTFGGKSPVFTLHNDPLGWEWLAAGFAPDRYDVRFQLTNYVRRGQRDDADEAEAMLDALLEAAVAVVQANRTHALWATLEMENQTEPDYYLVDGVQYRVEVLRLTATVRT